MLWFALSLLLALGLAGKSALVKKAGLSLDPYLMTWGYTIVSALALAPVAWLSGVPALGPDFWWVLAIDGVLLVGARLMYVAALQQSDLSIVMPLLTFTPAFLLITSPVMIDEVPSALGAAGILAIVAGAYLLNLSDREHGLLEPFRSLVRERGARLMLGTAFIYSITSNIDRVGILASDPLFWAFAVNAAVALLMTPGLLRDGRLGALRSAVGGRYLVAAGLVTAFVAGTQMFAITLTLVAYVNAVKRTSVLFGVLLGWLVFRERGIRERLVGAAIMVAGVALIVLG